MTTPAPNPFRTLARLLLRHHLAVAHELLPLEAIRTMERAIGQHMVELDIKLDHRVRRCGLAQAVAITHTDGGGTDTYLMAAEILMYEFGENDPISRVFPPDDHDVFKAQTMWERFHGPAPQHGLTREVMQYFLPPNAIDRYEDLRSRPDVDPAGIAKFLLIGLEHESLFEPQGPQFEWLDMEALLAEV